jgi:glycosyltransferase involved in cell wall biosynthesis
MNDSAGKPNISLFFPVYNDEGTVRAVTEKAIRVLSELCSKFEIVIVNDGSPDRAGEIADQLAHEHPEVSVVHHERNMGYGRALQSGFARARRYEWICFTDGDDQYDVGELRNIVNLLPRYDMVITFRYCKIYSTWRMFLSWIYNHIVRWLFRSPFRDIGCGLKIVRREVIDHIEVKSSSPFVGAEIVHRAMLKGYLIGEVGITTYPRELGQSTTTSWRNIIGTIRDMLRFHEEVYSNRARTAKT